MTQETESETVKAARKTEIRRVLTGRDQANKSIFVSSGPTPRMITFDTLPGTVFWEMYATDDIPSLSGREADPVPGLNNLVPRPHGSRFRLVQFGPSPPKEQKIPPVIFDKMKIEITEKLPGLAEQIDWADFPSHATDTVDYGVVIKGEIVLELDDGNCVHLRQGDCVVQNGTTHRWMNPLAEPCLMAFVMIGGKRLDQ
jgi:hypothetical protein